MTEPFTALFDVHAPFHDNGCLALAFEYIRLTRPRKIILGGDIVDCYGVKGNKFRREHVGPRYIKDEFAACEKEFLKPLLDVANGADIIWIEGNHEDRYENRLFDRLYRTDLEAIYGMVVTIPEFFRLKERGIQYIRSKAGNGIYHLTPHLTVMHGERTTVQAARLQSYDWGGSLIMGHTHQENLYKRHFGNRREWASYVSGCLCIDSTYRDICNWTKGFVGGWTDEHGKFGVSMQPIIEKTPTEKELVSPELGRITARATKSKDGSYKWSIESAKSNTHNEKLDPKLAAKKRKR